MDVKAACRSLNHTFGVFRYRASGSNNTSHVAYSLSGEPPVPSAVCELGDEFVQPPTMASRRRRVRDQSPEASQVADDPPVSAQSSRSSDKPRKVRTPKVSWSSKVDHCIEALTFDRDAAIADADQARNEASLSNAALRELTLVFEKVYCQCCEAFLTMFTPEIKVTSDRNVEREAVRSELDDAFMTEHDAAVRGREAALAEASWFKAAALQLTLGCPPLLIIQPHWKPSSTQNDLRRCGTHHCKFAWPLYISPRDFKGQGPRFAASRTVALGALRLEKDGRRLCATVRSRGCLN